MAEDIETFAGVKKRLDEIVEAVSSDDLPLDDALALYEEAVTLGLRASDLLEADINIDAEAQAAEEAAAAQGDSDNTAQDNDASAAQGVSPAAVADQAAGAVGSAGTAANADKGIA